jgi:Cu2+-containing amine oxidase
MINRALSLPVGARGQGHQKPKRSGLSWVTPYKPEELYAGGTCPIQSYGGDGLGIWGRTNPHIENTESALW